MRTSIVLALLCLIPATVSFATEIGLDGIGGPAQDPNISVVATVVNPLTPVAVTQVFPAAAGTAELFYDPNDGEFTVAVGSGVAAIGLEGPNFILGNLDNSTGLGAFQQADAVGIGRFVIPGSLPTGVFQIGQLLAPGFATPADFVNQFGLLEFRTTAPGTPILSAGVNILPLAEAIPEPGCLSLLGIAGVSLLARRRRLATA